MISTFDIRYHLYNDSLVHMVITPGDQWTTVERGTRKFMNDLLASVGLKAEVTDWRIVPSKTIFYSSFYSKEDEWYDRWYDCYVISIRVANLIIFDPDLQKADQETDTYDSTGTAQADLGYLEHPVQSFLIVVERFDAYALQAVYELLAELDLQGEILLQTNYHIEISIELNVDHLPKVEEVLDYLRKIGCRTQMYQDH